MAFTTMRAAGRASLVGTRQPYIHGWQTRVGATDPKRRGMGGWVLHTFLAGSGKATPVARALPHAGMWGGRRLDRTLAG